MLLLFALIQTSSWSVTPPTATVGDTVLIERVIPLEGVDARARVAPLEPSASIQPLAPPRITYESAGVRVQLIVAGFAADSVRVVMPDVELIYGDGTVETVAGGTATFYVGSVLPAVSDSSPEPMPSQAPIGRVTTNVTLPVVLPLMVLALTGTWGILRRRRRARPGWDPGGPDVVEPPVSRWIQMGEHRAVAALAMARFRERLSDIAPETTAAMSVAELMDTLRDHHPDWPLAGLGDAFHSLERASFAPAVAADVLAIVESAEECLRDLERAKNAETEAPAA